LAIFTATKNDPLFVFPVEFILVKKGSMFTKTRVTLTAFVVARWQDADVYRTNGKSRRECRRDPLEGGRRQRTGKNSDSA